jgi:CheY-like chemotaxis protein
MGSIVSVTMRVLIIEDDRKAAQLLAKGLREERFIVDLAHSAEIGDELASVNDYDVIILDWLLPDGDGIEVCRGLRARNISTPILMLTARDALEDRVTGLNMGADDYLVKPFGFSELLARIHALLRRSDLTRPVVLSVADLTLDPLSHRVTRGGVPIDLTETKYDDVYGRMGMFRFGAAYRETPRTESVLNVIISRSAAQTVTVGTVGGTPRIALNVGGSTVFANYVSGSGSTNLVFQYTVQAGNTDANGISIGANSLQANGGSLADAAGNTAVLTDAGVADNASFLVEFQWRQVEFDPEINDHERRAGKMLAPASNILALPFV